MVKTLEDYDWEEAFKYANPTQRVRGAVADVPLTYFDRDDVLSIIASDEGENDGNNWIMLGRLKDDRLFFLEAGCDYTGWDCHAGGSSYVSMTAEDLINFAMDKKDRFRLGLSTERDISERVTDAEKYT
jgi:hypothetical protein